MNDDAHGSTETNDPRTVAGWHARANLILATATAARSQADRMAAELRGAKLATLDAIADLYDCACDADLAEAARRLAIMAGKES